MPVKVVSAAEGRVCYNVESHLNGGNTAYHPRPLTLRRLAREFLVQIGQGIRGFMFWQFHAESIGLESPAWGLLDPGGRPRRAYESAGKFHQALGEHFQAFMTVPPPRPAVGIYLAAANEIFQWCIGRMDDAGKSVGGYTELMYWNSIPCRYVPADRVTDEHLAALKVLILPQAYCISQPEADAILRWVRCGGLLIAEAHTAGYNFTTGRHAGLIPGCGLAEAFGIVEIEPWDSPAQDCDGQPVANGQPAEDLQQDVIVAMGGRFRGDLLAIRMADGGEMTCGYKRRAALAVDEQCVVARYLNGSPAAALKRVGEGAVFYAGSEFGPILHESARPVAELLLAKIRSRLAPVADVAVTGEGRAHLDALVPAGGSAMFILVSEGQAPCEVSWAVEHPLRGVFGGTELPCTDGRVSCPIQGDFADLFVPAP